MSSVFISYARGTEAKGRQVAQALRDHGHEVWTDDEIPPHRSFGDVIEERLRAAGAVVVIWSAEAARSEWVRSEASRARAMGKLVQLTIDKAPLPMPFDQIECARLMDWSGDTDARPWRKILASVSELTGPPDAALLASSDGDPAAPGSGEPLLAVLAFDNLSADPEMAYFSDGVSEEIQHTIAHGSDLRVIGRTSSFHYRGPAKVVRRLAEELKATHVLDGAVRCSGPRVRISAQLIECASETTLWADRFDRDLSDVFALQDEIAAAVAAALKVVFAPAGGRTAVDPVAHDLYLKAMRLPVFNAASRRDAIAWLEQATTLAPAFARAWTSLAAARARQLRFDEIDEPYAAKRVRVVEAAETALRLDPGQGMVHQALALLEPFGCYREREALERRALALSPGDPNVLTEASYFLTQVGRVREALARVEQAFTLDPMSPWTAGRRAAIVSFTGRYAEARELWDRFRVNFPDNRNLTRHAISTAVYLADWQWLDTLLAGARHDDLMTPEIEAAVGMASLLRDRRPETLHDAISQVRARLARAGTVSFDSLIGAYRLGLADDTFDLVDRSSFDFMFDATLRWPEGVAGVAQIFNVSMNDGMMRDPRFPRLCAKLGLCDYWTESDRWPDCAEPGLLPYDFKAECRRMAAA